MPSFERYVFPFVPIEKNIKQETPDSARFQLLISHNLEIFQ